MSFKEMNIIIKYIFSIIMMIGLSLGMYAVFALTDHGDVSFKIAGLGIRHGTPDNQNLGTITASPYDQEISGQFADYFRVEDLQGYITGHYTTIQCDGIYGPAGMILTGIFLKAGNNSPTLIQGLTGPNVVINPALFTYTGIYQPITYIYKMTAVNNAGIVNRYGDKPWLKIFIPAATPPGLYSGTIVFSFYME